MTFAKFAITTAFIVVIAVCPTFAALAALGTLQISNDVPIAIRSELNADLEHLKSIRGGATSPLHRQVFGNHPRLDGGDYYDFFLRHVTRVDLHPSQKDFFVTAGGGTAPLTLFVSREYVKYRKTLSAFERLAILIHEARHNEAEHDYWPHATCPNPFLGLGGKPQVAPWGQGLAGKPACDHEALASYGVTYIMARNIAAVCETCTKQEKQEAATYADNIILRITDHAAQEQLKQDH